MRNSSAMSRRLMVPLSHRHFQVQSRRDILFDRDPLAIRERVIEVANASGLLILEGFVDRLALFGRQDVNKRGGSPKARSVFAGA